MAEKRKLPARASARVELRTSKRRSAAYDRSESPATPPAKSAKKEVKKEVKKEPTPPPPPPPPLPTALEAGEPLPSVETAQPADLSDEDFQTILESGVLTESLTRSRQKWINEGLFEKYWSKPHKRKGVMIEDPKNPPKDTMSRAGAVTIIIEPHIIEATMYTVKGPKPPPLAQQPQQQMQYPQQNYQQTQMQMQQPIQPTAQRPIIQYGPTNGGVPPAAATPAAPSPVQATPVSAPPAPTLAQPPTEPAKVAATPAAAASPVPAAKTAPAAPKAASTPAKATPAGVKGTTTQSSSTPAKPAPAAGSAAPAAKPATNGPVIAMLAEKASREPPLRDLMKRVAVGQAKADELAQFQKIINQLTEEHEKKMLAQAPSADKLMVDGRTVQYFASEVRSILDIVLKSNPTQKAADLRAPEGSDPLLVLLVKLALDDQKVALSIRRLADKKHNSTDAQELKNILDRLIRDAKITPHAGQGQAGNIQMQNGARQMQPQMQYPNQQAIRAKAPLPNRPDIASVVFDLGTGDRYLFPKYSIVEYLPAATGQQLLASFLIVRKGSSSERGGDPSLDYYQPVTIRLQSTSGRHLEHLARVVAPQDEVRRYMDDVMDNMTRAEYVLLAMRLPRPGREEDDEDETMADAEDESQANSKAPTQEPEGPSVLWTVKAGSSTPTGHVPRSLNTLDLEEEAQEKYQKLVRSTAERHTELI